MKSTKVASRYAKALLEIAKEQNKVSSVLKDMNFLLQTNSSTTDFESLISSPIISAEKKN
jgi:F-type H+-transporting ATPase subunit delta